MDTEKYHLLLKDKPEWGTLATFVPNKRLPVYNWLYFKEGFARDKTFNLIKLFGLRRGDWVLDPYCGSGTTLLACKEKDINSIGIDLLPIAVLASRVKTGEYNTEELRKEAKTIFEKKFEKIPFSFPFSRFFNKHVLEDIMLFKRETDRIENEKTRAFFLLALINSAMKASWLWKDGNVLKVKKHPLPPFRKFFKRRVSKMIKEAERFRGTGKALVKQLDPRNLDLWDGTIDSVITSPPYLNQIDYSKVYAVENWFVGNQQEIPSYRGPEKEKQYFSDLEKVLKELFRVCKKGAKAGMVVGNAYFPKEERIVESDLILSHLAENIGFTVREILVLNKRFALQRRTIKKGVLRESLIILEK